MHYKLHPTKTPPFSILPSINASMLCCSNHCPKRIVSPSWLVNSEPCRNLWWPHSPFCLTNPQSLCRFPFANPIDPEERPISDTPAKVEQTELRFDYCQLITRLEPAIIYQSATESGQKTDSLAQKLVSTQKAEDIPRPIAA